MASHDYSQPIKYTDIDTGKEEGPYCPKCFFDKECLSYAKTASRCSFATGKGTLFWCCERDGGPNVPNDCGWEVPKDS